MLYSERVEEILRLLQRQNAVKVNDLAQLLNVSVDTVRRDLHQMEQNGQIKCVRGGACLPDSLAALSRLKGREVINIERKERAARKAMKHIHSGMLIALNSGTTNTILAQEIALRGDAVTVVTNNLAAQQILMQNPNIQLIAVGGLVDPLEQSTYGNSCEKEFGMYLPDIAFLSINAVSQEDGFTDFRYHEFGILRTLAKNASRAIAVMDSTKLGRSSRKKVLEFTDVDRVIMDEGITEKLRKQYKKSGLIIE